MVENSRLVPNLSGIYPPNIYKGHLISSAGFVLPGFQLPCPSCPPGVIKMKSSICEVFTWSCCHWTIFFFFFLQDKSVIIGL